MVLLVLLQLALLAKANFTSYRAGQIKKMLEHSPPSPSKQCRLVTNRTSQD